MKKMLLIGFLAITLSSSMFAREAITPEEENTVKVLTNLGIVEKYRDDQDLNQPLSAIDSMSMEIKSLLIAKEDVIARDKEIINRLGDRLMNLEDDLVLAADKANKHLVKLDKLKREKEDSDKFFAIVASILFILSIR
jgi:hypothetical protein